MSTLNFSKMNLSTLLLIPVGIAINFVGGQIIAALKLPLFIDTIGTILVAALCGPWIGALTGGITNIALTVTQPTFMPFAIVSIVNGLVVGFLARKFPLNSWKNTLIIALAVWLATQLTSNPITVFVFNGVTGTGSSGVTAFFLTTGQKLVESVITTALLTETVDKFISAFAVFFIIRALPVRSLLQFPCGEQYTPQTEQVELDEEDWN